MRHPVIDLLIRLVQCALAVAGALLLWFVVTQAMARPTDPFINALRPFVTLAPPAIITFIIASFIRSPRWLFAFAALIGLSPVVFTQLYFSTHTPVPEGQEPDLGPGMVFVLLGLLAIGAVLGAIAKGVALAVERAGQSTTTAMVAQTAVVLAAFVIAAGPSFLAVRPS